MASFHIFLLTETRIFNRQHSCKEQAEINYFRPPLLYVLRKTETLYVTWLTLTQIQPNPHKNMNGPGKNLYNILIRLYSSCVARNSYKVVINLKKIL